MDENKIEEKMDDKIKEIEIFLEELESSLPSDFENYKSDYKIKAICERYFEKIIEAVVDLAFIFIKEKKFGLPEEDIQAFEILVENEVISKTLALKLKDAKGMRNFIAHQYGKINDELVFHAVTEELIPDIKEFILAINSKT